MAPRTTAERDALKNFLFKAVSVQKDAEPQLLADYLFALLENNESIGQEELTTEVSEFVETDAPQLARTLYQSIQSKSYLAPSAFPSSPTPKQIPTGPASASKKRRLSDSGDVEMSDGNKITRLNEGPAGGPSNGFDRGMAGDFGMRGRRGRGGAGMDMGRRKKPCFDYHNKGFCARGVNCHYEHGPDTMYALPGAPMGMPSGMPPMPFPFMMPFPQNGSPNSIAPPGEGQPVNKESMQVDGASNLGEYNPEQPGLGPSSPHGAAPFPFPPGGPPPPGMIPFMMGMQGMFPQPFDQPGRGGHSRGRGRNGRGGRGGRTEGFNDWDGSLSNKPPQDNQGNTLVVAEIPPEHLNLESIHNQFKQFGTVTNVAVEVRAKKALVAFATNREAYAAWSNKESFFGDRHVKILWHRPREGQGEIGQKALTDSAPLLENLRRIEKEGVDAFQQAGKGLPVVDNELREQLAAVRERGLQLEKIVAEQKVLMVRLESTKEAEEKTKLKTRLKELIAQSKDVKEANAGIDVDKLQGVVEAQQKAREEAKAKLAAQREARRVEHRPAEGVHSIQEMLDAEMEEHNIAAQLEDSKDKKDEEVDEETLKLRAQLAALKSQASNLGINPDATSFTPRGGYRGRGGGYRGRGAFPINNRSLKLDNRPRALNISSPAIKQDERLALQRVKEWFISLSDALTQEPMVVDGSVIVSFSSRGSAETALALGDNIPSFTPPARVGWHIASAPEIPAGAPALGMESVSVKKEVKQEADAQRDIEIARGERDADE